MIGVFTKFFRVGYVLHQPGEKVNMTLPEWAEAVERGVIVPEGVEEAPAETPTPTPTPTPVPAPVEPASPAARRPRKTAPKAEWEAYAKQLGIKTSGMSVREIIAACSKS